MVSLKCFCVFIFLILGFAFLKRFTRFVVNTIFYHVLLNIIIFCLILRAQIPLLRGDDALIKWVTIYEFKQFYCVGVEQWEVEES